MKNQSKKYISFSFYLIDKIYNLRLIQQKYNSIKIKFKISLFYIDIFYVVNCFKT